MFNIIDFGQAIVGILKSILDKLATYGEAIGAFFSSIFSLIGNFTDFFANVSPTSPIALLGFLCTVGIALIAFRIIAHFL